MSDTIDTTLYGNVVFKLVQGVLGGAMFWVLGLPAARHFYSQVVKSVIDEGEAVQVILDCGYKDKSTSAGRIWS